MKKEVRATANKLLEILYLHDIDQAALDDLDLNHKYNALSKLKERKLVEEIELKLPSGDKYKYFNLTEQGEKQHESGGLEAGIKISAIPATLIVVAATVLIMGIAIGLISLIIGLRRP